MKVSSEYYTWEQNRIKYNDKTLQSIMNFKVSQKVRLNETNCNPKDNLLKIGCVVSMSKRSGVLTIKWRSSIGVSLEKIHYSKLVIL